MIVADTDVVIDALRGREPAATRVGNALAGGILATTAINAFELRSGARTAKESALVERFLSAIPILPFDFRASHAAAGARRELEPKGRTIGMGDYLIAGICVSHGLTLLTRNRRHFDRIPQLNLDTL